MRGVVARGTHEVVIGFGEGGGDDFALRGVGVTAQPTTSTRATNQAAKGKIGVAGRAFGDTDLHARAVIDQRQDGGGFVGLERAGNEADEGGSATKAANGTANAAGVARAHDHFGGEAVISTDHLAFAEVAAGAQFAALLQVALLPHLTHGTTTVDDDEAVRLLNNQPQHRHRGGEVVGLRVGAIPLGTLVFNDGDGANRAVAFFQRLLRTFGIGTTGGTASERFGRIAARGRGGDAGRKGEGSKARGQQGETTVHKGNTPRCTRKRRLYYCCTLRGCIQAARTSSSSSG